MSTFNVRRGLLGLSIGLVSHALPFLFGFIAGRVVQPSEGGGFEDVAAVAVIFLLAEASLCLVVIAGMFMLFAKQKKEIGLGLLAGWIIGALAIWIILRMG